MLRLGRKYGFDGLYADAKSRLTTEFPTKFDDISSVYTYIEAQNGLIIDVVNLAREIGIPSVLPLALYFCYAPRNYKDVICGERRDDGSIASLSQQDKDVCLLACPSLLEAQFKHTLAWLSTSCVPSPHCTSPHECKAARANIKSSIWVPVPEIHAVDNWDDCYEGGLCDACEMVAKGAHEAGQREVWSQLPSFFGLPSWESLEKDQD